MLSRSALDADLARAAAAACLDGGPGVGLAGQVPGLAYGVVLDGELVDSGGRGVAVIGQEWTPDADTVFRIASMTKSFTATMVLALRDEGLVSLEDPVAAHVPEVAGMGLATADSAPVTVRQLLTMSAGLPTDDPWGDRQQGLAQDEFGELVAGGLRFAWPNGCAFEYSNLGYALLGRLITAVTGQDYAQVMRRRVLDPLELSSSGYHLAQLPAARVARGYSWVDDAWQPVPFDGYGAFASMGGLFSTVRDLARWVAGFTDAYPARDDLELPAGLGGHPLRRASRREMQQPHRAAPPTLTWQSLDAPGVLRVAGYGFGLFVELDPELGPIVGHSGGYPGFGSAMRWHPDSGLGVVLLANATYAAAPRVADQLLRRLLRDRPPAGVARAGCGGAVPRSGGPWPETRQAQRDVESLLNRWDDALADRLFAMNVDLDEPLPRRRAQLEQLQGRYGPFGPAVDAPPVSESPAHLAWWLCGRDARVQLEIRMTPQLPPRVQTLRLVIAVEPSSELDAAARAVVAAFAGPQPRWPQQVPRRPELGDLDLLVALGARWAGPARLGPVEAGDGRRESVIRVCGTHRDLLMVIGMADGVRVDRFQLRPG